MPPFPFVNPVHPFSGQGQDPAPSLPRAITTPPRAPHRLPPNSLMAGEAGGQRDSQRSRTGQQEGVQAQAPPSAAAQLRATQQQSQAPSKALQASGNVRDGGELKAAGETEKGNANQAYWSPYAIQR